MIKSMTGYGSSELVTDRFSLKVEIKSLNSKFFDPILKLPKEFADKEVDIKNQLTQGLNRGKVFFSIEFQVTKFDQSPIEINKELFQAYFDEFKALAESVNSEKDEIFKLAIYSPNVIVTKDQIPEDMDWGEVSSVIQSAVDHCNEFRATEGTKLHDSLLENLRIIRESLDAIDKKDPQRAENIKARLDQGLSDIKERVQVDPNRFEQEIIYYLEKLDISEEKVRLKSHIEYFEKVLEGDQNNGKKLGFIAQEIGREINTIGSKANDAEIQRIVVGMKDELEKIKEQSLNVL